MSVFFLASRTLILLALIILIIAAIWGWANNTSAEPVPEQTQLEKYASKRPGPATTAFFIISIFLGAVIITFSIWLEYMRVRDAKEEAARSRYAELPEHPARLD